MTELIVIPKKILKAYNKEHAKFRKMMDKMPMFFNNQAIPKKFKKHVEETFPVEHYGQDILIYEACSLRTYLEKATMIGYLMGSNPAKYKKKNKDFQKQGEILNLFKIKIRNSEYLLSQISQIEIKGDFVVFNTEYAMVPLKVDKAVFLEAYNKAIKNLEKKYFK